MSRKFLYRLDSLEEYNIQIDATDELPVLSEETGLPHGAAESSGPIDRLATAVAALQASLDRMERCWQRLEVRIEAHYQAIHDLNRTLRQARTSRDGAPEPPPTPAAGDGPTRD